MLKTLWENEMKKRLDLPFVGIPSFCGVPIVTNLASLDADVAIFGVPFDQATQYRAGARFGPRGIREGSSLVRVSPYDVYDPDRDEVYFGRRWKIVDCGDVDMVHGDLTTCHRNIQNAVSAIADRGALPVAMGGDHSVTIPLLEGLKNKGPFGIIQFDAHLDFVDHRHGQKFGQGSPMRRAAEMDHVTVMAQFGIRGSGSSSYEDFQDARAYGSVIKSVNEIRQIGIEAALAAIPRCDRYYVTFDIDGMDACLAPGTGTPSQGGFQYPEMNTLLEGIAKLGDIVGFDMVEVAPDYDQSGITVQLAALLMQNFIGFILKEREFR
jgi:agmatinase